MKRTIEYINGRPVITVKKTVTEEVELPEWLASAKDLASLVGGLQRANIPFLLKSPGVPNRRGVLDRYRVTVYAAKTAQVESYSGEGLAKQAHAQLAEAETPALTISMAIAEDSTPKGEELEDSVEAANEDAEAIVDEVKNLEKHVEDELWGSGDLPESPTDGAEDPDDDLDDLTLPGLD